MLDAAISALMSAYDKDSEIESVRKIKQSATVKLQDFPKERLELLRANAAALKPKGEADTAEIVRYIRTNAEYEMFKLYHDTYSEIYEHPAREQEINRNMQKELKRIRRELKEAIDFYTAFKGVQMELKGV